MTKTIKQVLERVRNKGFNDRKFISSYFRDRIAELSGSKEIK